MVQIVQIGAIQIVQIVQIQVVQIGLKCNMNLRMEHPDCPDCPDDTPSEPRRAREAESNGVTTRRRSELGVESHFEVDLVIV